MTEEWHDISEYEGRYRVSTLGRVMSLQRMVTDAVGTHELPERIMAQYTHRSGYLFLYLKKNGGRVKCFVHRLVAQAFIPNPDNLPYVNHRHGDKKDNRDTELEWMTPGDNTRHFLRGRARVEEREMAF